MVRHDVAGTVRQEQIVQYIQHINPVHTTNGGGGGGGEGGLGGGPSSEKIVGAFAPMALRLLYHCVYKKHTIQLHT